MNLSDAKIGDILLSYGGAEDNKPLNILHGQIRGAQKAIGYREYGATHVQIRCCREGLWASDEAEGVILHEPKIYSDRKYRLVRVKQELTHKGLLAMQAYIDSHKGDKYDRGQLASIGIAVVFAKWRFPAFLGRWLGKRFDGGGNYTVCSGLVYDALRAAGVVLPLPRLDPNRRNPGERAMPCLYEPANNPEYFELIAES